MKKIYILLIMCGITTTSLYPLKVTNDTEFTLKELRFLATDGTSYLVLFDIPIQKTLTVSLENEELFDLKNVRIQMITHDNSQGTTLISIPGSLNDAHIVLTTPSGITHSSNITTTLHATLI